MADTIRFDRIYAMTGVTAIVVGALVVAFGAKQPSTLAMWVSAYLVLVVGVAQVFLAVVVAELMQKHSKNLLYQIFILFNIGNTLVILSTALKYGGYDNHVTLTIMGAITLMAAMGWLGWLLRSAKASRLKTWTYVMLLLLISSALVGIVLAGVH